MSRKRDEFIPLGDVAEAVELSGDRALASRPAGRGVTDTASAAPTSRFPQTL